MNVIRYLVFTLLLTGCAVSVPKNDLFSEAMLIPEKPEQAVVFIYSISEFWNADATYKYIVLNGEHVSTITSDTFARLTLDPGLHSIRVTEHGWDGVEFPKLFFTEAHPSVRKQHEDTIELNIEAGTTLYLAIDWDQKTIQFQCKETDESINICSRQSVGVALKIRDHDVALNELSTLHEVCHECD